MAGCYGGYVPASAFSLRAKRFGIDLSGRDGFVPADMGGAMAMLSDMACRVATEAVALCRITGADEVILAGGITSGFTGVTLAKAANEAIARNYPAFAERIKVTLSRSNINYGGAIGAARYALAMQNTGEEKNRPKWDLHHDLPEISIGRGNIEAFFDSLRAADKKACIVMQRELGDHLSNIERHLWFIREKARGNIVWLDNFKDREALVAELRARGADFIVPIGAGTVTDWGKFAGAKLLRQVVAFQIPCGRCSNTSAVRLCQTSTPLRSTN